MKKEKEYNTQTSVNKLNITDNNSSTETSRKIINIWETKKNEKNM